MKSIIYFLTLTTLTMAQPVRAQFTDILKSAKKHAEKVLAPQSQPQIPHGKQGSNPTQQPIPLGSGAPGEIKKAELWPNLEVDEAIVAKQQAAFKEDCAKQSSGPTKDCDCMASSFPKARLIMISEKIREVKRRMDLSCGGDNESQRCQTTKATFNDMTSKEYQIRYPEQLAVGEPGYRVGQPAPRNSNVKAGFPVNIYSYLPSCINAKKQGEDETNNCLANAESGAIRLPPGKSTKAYCACVGEEISRAYQSSRESNSPDSVHIATQAQITCQSK